MAPFNKEQRTLKALESIAESLESIRYFLPKGVKMLVAALEKPPVDKPYGGWRIPGE